MSSQSGRGSGWGLIRDQGEGDMHMVAGRGGVEEVGPTHTHAQLTHLFVLCLQSQLHLLQVPEEVRVEGGGVLCRGHWGLGAFHHWVPHTNPLGDAAIQNRHLLMAHDLYAYREV